MYGGQVRFRGERADRFHTEAAKLQVLEEIDLDDLLGLEVLGDQRLDKAVQVAGLPRLGEDVAQQLAAD